MSVLPQSTPQPSFPVFVGIFARFVAQLLAERAHATVQLTLKDGHIQLVRVDRSYLPGQLPRLPDGAP